MNKVNRGSFDDTMAAMFSNSAYNKSYLFYAHMISQCTVKIEPNLPAPAGIAFNFDHYDLYINPKEFDEETLPGRLAILKHEMIHILDDHIGRMNQDFERDPLLWNWATDCALNQLIDSNHLPDYGITPESLGKQLGINVPKNESAETYYNLIVSVMPPQHKSQGNTQGDEQGQGSDDSDTDNKPISNSGGHTKENSISERSMDSHETWGKSEGDKDLRKAVTKRMIDTSTTQTLKSAGTLPSQVSDWLELHSYKAQINWRKVLRNIVANKRANRRPTVNRRDRRMPHREDLRGKIKDRVFNILTIVDVSGSMNDKAITETIGEIKNICKNGVGNTMVQIDTVAYPPEELTVKTLKFNRKGSGGTTLFGAIEMADKHKVDYQAVVVLTDGYIFKDDLENFQTIKKKVVWLIESDGADPSQFNLGQMRGFRLDPPTSQAA